MENMFEEEDLSSRVYQRIVEKVVFHSLKRGRQQVVKVMVKPLAAC